MIIRYKDRDKIDFKKGFTEVSFIVFVSNCSFYVCNIYEIVFLAY